MNSVQPESLKIKKQLKPTKPTPIAESNFACGECSRGYQSYPALRLHIKRRHDGIMPPNTKVVKPLRPPLHIDVLPGRPTKPVKDIDDLRDIDAAVEITQNDLMSFLGEKLMVTRDFAPKLPLEAVVAKISEIQVEDKEKWFLDIQEECDRILKEQKARTGRLTHLDLDEDLLKQNSGNGLRIITWFLIWLAEIYVKIEFLPDLCILFSKIWKVLDKDGLDAQDLDNKLVWKKVLKEGEDIIKSLNKFKDDPTLLFPFIQKVCQLIGKTIEGKSASDS